MQSKVVSGAILTALLLALILTQSSLSQPQYPGEDFQTALRIDLIPGETILPESGYYLLNESMGSHYFELRGLEGGYRLRVEVEVVGVEQGRVAIAIYSGSGELIAQEKLLYGSGTKEEAELVYQPSRESAGPAAIHYLALTRYSGALKYRLKLILESVEDYAPGEGDAGSDPETAIILPTIASGEPLSVRGYLASRQEGGDYADHVDYYRLRVIFADSHDVLRLRFKPASGQYLSATIYQEGFRLKHNKSKAAGEEFAISLGGEWENGREYEFVLRVDNLGGRGGGGYQFEAWIEEAASQTATSIQTQPGPGGLEESAVKLLIIAGAAALVAISIIMLLLRRRRLYRVEEVGWWGEETW